MSNLQSQITQYTRNRENCDQFPGQKTTDANSEMTQDMDGIIRQNLKAVIVTMSHKGSQTHLKQMGR